MMSMFNYNHLYYFYTVARLKGVTKAAVALRISQPSLSIQIKNLENELALNLFQKVGRSLKLTYEGERVFEYCKKIFESAEDLEDYLKHKSGHHIKRCNIGVAPEVERPFVADVLSGLLRKSTLTPKPHLSLLTFEHKELITRLGNAEIDVMVTNHAVHAGNAKLLAELSMPVFAVANIKKFKELDSKVSLAKALSKRKVDLVLPSNSLKLRLETDLFLQKHRIRNEVVFESDILSVIVRAVLEGVGVGLLPLNYIQKELSQKKICIINSGSPLWKTKLFVYARSKQIDDLTIQLIKKHFLELGAKT